MPQIHWPQFNKTIEVAAGTSVLDAALDNQIPLDHACGGFCACTTCHVLVKNGLDSTSPIEDMEKDKLEFLEDKKPESRLGCQTLIHGDVTIVVPESLEHQ